MWSKSVDTLTVSENSLSPNKTAIQIQQNTIYWHWRNWEKKSDIQQTTHQLHQACLLPLTNFQSSPTLRRLNTVWSSWNQCNWFLAATEIFAMRLSWKLKRACGHQIQVRDSKRTSWTSTCIKTDTFKKSWIKVSMCVESLKRLSEKLIWSTPEQVKSLGLQGKLTSSLNTWGTAAALKMLSHKINEKKVSDR